jgi:hypothetical protein
MGVNGIRRLKGLIAWVKSAEPGKFWGTLAAVKQSVSAVLFWISETAAPWIGTAASRSEKRVAAIMMADTAAQG